MFVFQLACNQIYLDDFISMIPIVSDCDGFKVNDDPDVEDYCKLTDVNAVADGD